HPERFDRRHIRCPGSYFFIILFLRERHSAARAKPCFIPVLCAACFAYDHGAFFLLKKFQVSCFWFLVLNQHSTFNIQHSSFYTSHLPLTTIEFMISACLFLSSLSRIYLSCPTHRLLTGPGKGMSRSQCLPYPS